MQLLLRKAERSISAPQCNSLLHSITLNADWPVTKLLLDLLHNTKAWRHDDTASSTACKPLHEKLQQRLQNKIKKREQQSQAA